MILSPEDLHELEDTIVRLEAMLASDEPRKQGLSVAVRLGPHPLAEETSAFLTHNGTHVVRAFREALLSQRKAHFATLTVTTWQAKHAPRETTPCP